MRGVSRVPGDIILSSSDLGLADDGYKGAAIKPGKLARTQSYNNVLGVKYLQIASCSTEAGI